METINQNSNAFSFNRLLAFVRLDIAENWKSFAFGVTGVYAFYFIFNFIWMWTASTSDYPTPEDAEAIFLGNVPVASIFMMIGFTIYGYLMAAGILSPMATKEKRINFLMVPATNIEKYAWRMVASTVIPWIAFAVAFTAAEFTRLLFALVFRLPDAFFTLNLGNIARFFFGINANFMVNSSGVIGMIWYISIFILGGCLWYKRPFLKTIAALIAGSFVLILTTMLVFKLSHGVNFSFSAEIGESVQTVYDIVIALTTVFNVWWSYRLFTRSQVIERKPSWK